MAPMKNPPHPGELVKHELAELGIPVADAATALGVTRQALYNVISGKSGISPEMAVRLAKGIGSTADGWLRMQLASDLSRLSPGDIKVRRLVSRNPAA